MLKYNANVAINSNKSLFVFELSKDKEIIFHMYDSSLNHLRSEVLNDQDVFKYSAIIDENDDLHVVALMNSGELSYYKYVESRWTSAKIGKFDLSSNIYNQMEIFMINNKLHIIYNYSNLINSNIWTIQHVIYDNRVEARHNAVRYISKKNPDPFVADVDKVGTIHLTYATSINNPQIFYSFYSPFTKGWASQAKQLSEKNSSCMHPYLFIDTKDNLHCLWIQELNGKSSVKYFKMSLNGKEKYIWKQISLPYIHVSNSLPILLEENNILKLIFTSDKYLDFLSSSDYGNSWFNEKASHMFTKNMSIIKVESNLSQDKNKITHAYFTLEPDLKFYLLDVYKDIETLDTIADTPEDCQNEEINEEINMDINKDIIDSISPNISDVIEGLNIQIDNIIINQKYIESILTNILNNQEDIESKLDMLEDIINSINRPFFQRIFNSPK